MGSFVASERNKANKTATYDVTWAAHKNWIWTGFEAELAIATASAPALKVFVKQYLDVTRYGTYASDAYESNPRTKRFSSYFLRSKRTNTTERSRRGDMEQGEESTIGFASKDGAQDVYLSNLGKRSESTSYGSGDGKEANYGIHTIATGGSPEPFQDHGYYHSTKSSRSADNITMGRAMAMERSHLEDDSGSDTRKNSQQSDETPFSPQSTRSMSLLRKKQGSRTKHERRPSSQNGIMVAREVQVNVENSQPSSDVEDNHDLGHDRRSAMTGSTSEAQHYDRSRQIGQSSRVYFYPGSAM